MDKEAFYRMIGKMLQHVKDPQNEREMRMKIVATGGIFTWHDQVSTAVVHEN